MALINKFFPRKIESNLKSLSLSSTDSCSPVTKQDKQRQIETDTRNNHLNLKRVNSNSNSCSVLSEDGKSNKTRLLLFSECDVRGRRLIYDSANGYLKEDPQDLELFKDMVFGSATLRYVGDNYRIHEFHDVNWKGYEVMLSKVFLAPPPSSPKKIEKSSNPSRLSNSSGMAKVHNDTTDSGVCEGNSSVWSSFGANPSITNSQTSFSSVSLPIPKIASSRKAVSDSLLLNVPVNRTRKIRLAVALLFLPCEDLKEISMREIIFEQFPLVEQFLQRLQLGVLRAYSSRNSFLMYISDAIRQFHKDVSHIYSPYIENPAYFHLPTQKSSAFARDFMSQMESVVSQTDTKLTHFFWSCLLSAVLTYHVHWLYSYASEPVDFFECGTRVLILSKDKCLAQRLLYVLSYFVRGNHATQQARRQATQIHSRDLAASDKFKTHILRLSKAKDEALPWKNVTNEEMSTSVTGSKNMGRRNSQQAEHFRYLRSYYDVRFQLSPDTIALKERTSFANVKYSIAKNDFHDLDLSFSDMAATDDSSVTSTLQKNNQCAFFIGSVPDRSNGRIESPVPFSVTTASSELKPIEVSIPSATVTLESSRASYLSQWTYGSQLNDEYQAGRVIQSCDPSSCDWLKDLQLDLRAAVSHMKTASCIVANTDTWEIQVLTCIEEDVFPPRVKQFWVPVTMSGQVAALIESTQLLWQMKQDPEQCLDHIENYLQFLCQKSEDLGSLLSTSLRSWNLDHIIRLLDVETQDIPLLMAACSVHTPSVAHMGGVTIS